MHGHPNVIVFMTDQQRWDTSSFFGCPLELTPNYDLEHDPYELCNLVEDRQYLALREEFRERLVRKMSQIGEPSCTIEPAEPGTGGTRDARY